MFRRSFSALGALALVVLLYSPPAQANADAGKFIANLADKTFASLGEEGLSEEERVKRFRVLLNEGFDVPRIARFTLGRYWRVATDKEKKEFVALFEEFIILAYANRFRDLSGKKFNVIQSREINASQSLVISEIEIPGKPSVKVNWRVRSANAVHKIIDVMVEGISMSVTQRDEFVSVIRQTGGKVAGLINALRKKTGSK